MSRCQNALPASAAAKTAHQDPKEEEARSIYFHHLSFAGLVLMDDERSDDYEHTTSNKQQNALNLGNITYHAAQSLRTTTTFGPLRPPTSFTHHPSNITTKE